MGRCTHMVVYIKDLPAYSGTRSFEYQDDQGQIRDELTRDKLENGGTIYNYTYAYDAARNPTTIRSVAGYDYNSNNQLT